jgi:hypothetical protein
MNKIKIKNCAGQWHGNLPLKTAKKSAIGWYMFKKGLILW